MRFEFWITEATHTHTHRHTQTQTHTQTHTHTHTHTENTDHAAGRQHRRCIIPQAVNTV